jgi:hypothetical protein
MRGGPTVDPAVLIALATSRFARAIDEFDGVGRRYAEFVVL